MLKVDDYPYCKMRRLNVCHHTRLIIETCAFLKKLMQFVRYHRLNIPILIKVCYNTINVAT